MMNRLALSVDVEDWYHTPAVTGSDFSAYKDVPSFFNSYSGEVDFLAEPGKRVLDLLDEFQIKATFFVVADLARRLPAFIQEIAKRGHEIGCHGLYHATKIDSRTKQPRFSEKDFLKNTLEAKSILENVTQVKISGYRAPSAYFGKWMFPLLKECGFDYDSSLNPNSFFNKTDFSLSLIPSNPYWVSCESKGQAHKIFEIPWPQWNLFGLRFPVGGGPFLRFFGSKYILRGLKQTLKHGPSVFYFHCIDIQNKSFPKVATHNKRRPFYWAGKGQTVYRDLRHILSEMQEHWSTCHQIYQDALDTSGTKEAAFAL